MSQNIIENPPIKRFKEFKRHEPAHLDSSALMEYKRCPQRYFFRYVLGYNEKSTPIYFAWGTSYHRAKEVMEKEFMKGNSPLACVALGIQEGMKLWNNRRGVEKTKYDFMTPERLAETLHLAGKEWLKEKERGQIIVKATEQPFNVILPNGVVRTGRFDNIVLWNGNLWGRDFKTSTKDEQMYERYIYPNDQFAGYTFGQHILSGGSPELDGLKVKGQLVEVMYNERHTKEKKKGPILFTKTVQFTPQALKRWVDEQAYWEASRVAARENDLYPMNESQCAWCPYHRVCRLPTESAQSYELRTQFKFELWDNTYGED